MRIANILNPQIHLRTGFHSLHRLTVLVSLNQGKCSAALHTAGLRF
jgi:hypothetical protein